MKYLFSILISTICLLNCYSQSEELIGKWILVRTLYKDGSRVEINSKSYSLNLNYTISLNSIRFNGDKCDAVFTKDEIKTSTRNLTYILKENYLIETTESDNQTSYFLKVEDLIKKFPEFELKETNKNGETIYVDNDLSGYDFINELSFEDFIGTNMNISSGHANFQDFNFKIEFILTKENKIQDIKILQSTNKDFESIYLNALKNSEKYFKNISGKNLLITKEVDRLRWPEKIYKANLKGVQFYGKEKLKESIKYFEEVRNFAIQNNIFKHKSRESMLRLGISYLAVGKINEACRTFKEIGDKTDFEVRNYLLDFCSE